MTMYRPQRGSIDESMKEVVEVASFADLVAHLRSKRLLGETVPTVDNVRVEFYCLDRRIGWETWIVTVDGRANGYTDGPLGPTPYGPLGMNCEKCGAGPTLLYAETEQVGRKVFLRGWRCRVCKHLNNDSRVT